MPKKLTQEEFVQKANQTHNNKYDYSLVNYINSRTKVKIICPKHGIFEQTPDVHMRGQGCPKCKYEVVYNRATKQEFTEKAIEIHNNKYDYSLVDYKNNRTKVKIVCPLHGIFEQTPDVHLNKGGAGCPKCRSSKGENKIRNFLESSHILFEEQKRFKECKYKNTLPFDFYIPSKNLLIEYQGEQHYKAKQCFGGLDEFNKVKERDKIKREFANKNNFNFLEISYKDFTKINDILDTIIYKK